MLNQVLWNPKCRHNAIIGVGLWAIMIFTSIAQVTVPDLNTDPISKFSALSIFLKPIINKARVSHISTKEDTIWVVMEDDTVRVSSTDDPIDVNSKTPQASRFRITISACASEVAAKSEFKRRSETPSAVPNIKTAQIGDETLSWGNSTILFRQGTTVASIHGRYLGYANLVDKARLLSNLIGKTEMRQMVKDTIEIEALMQQAAIEKSRVPMKVALDKEQVGKLVSVLRNGVSSARDEQLAILELMRAGDPVAVPFLIERLEDTYPQLTREQAMKALGEIRDKRAIPKITAILEQPIKGDINDEDKNSGEAILRRNAAEQLGRFKEPSTLVLLKKLAASEHEYPRVREIAKGAAREMEKSE